jgi:hypothetical protein
MGEGGTSGGVDADDGAGQLDGGALWIVGVLEVGEPGGHIGVRVERRDYGAVVAADGGAADGIGTGRVVGRRDLGWAAEDGEAAKGPAIDRICGYVVAAAIVARLRRDQGTKKKTDEVYSFHAIFLRCPVFFTSKNTQTKNTYIDLAN